LHETAEQTAIPDSADIRHGEFGSLTPMVRRWRRRLPETLSAGAGKVVRIPPGNEELIHLLDLSAAT
jgi:hypothetical protein